MSIQIGRTTARHDIASSVELIGWLSLDSASASIPLARQFVKLALTARGYQDQASTLELVVSELVTNAVLHARSAESSPLWVRLLARDSALRLEVHDPDMRFPIPRLLGSESESGRGLHIVNALTDHVGSYLRDRGSGKVVWCELTLKEQPED